MDTAHKLMKPNIHDIENHLRWLTLPAVGAYDDALIEIAYQLPGDEGIRAARLFGLDEIPQAVDFAAMKNADGANVYVGASLKDPETPRHQRTTGADFYVATAIPIDIDYDYDAVRARMAAVVEDQLTVVTGTIPERRSQHWVRLVEPCEDAEAFGEAFAALVMHVGADIKVRDSARVMRLAGTISYPSERKQSKGYQMELTRLFANTSAKPVAIERLADLEPMPKTGDRLQRAAGFTPGEQAEIRRSLFDRVSDGRESYWRNIVFGFIADYQKEHGSDPTAEEIFGHAWEVFLAKADNSDGRWTSERGQRQLMKRVRNTLRRMRTGELGKFGVPSIETGAGEEEARRVQRQKQSVAEQVKEARQKPAPEPSFEKTRKVEEPEYIEGYGVVGGEDVSHEAPPDEEKDDLILDLDDLEDLDIEWLVEGLVPAQAFVSVYGAPGAYKSFVCQYIAGMVATGREAFGRPTKQGRVLYIALEGQRGIRGRFKAMERHHRFQKAPIKFVIRAQDFQSSIDDAERLLDRMERRGLTFDLIVIDTLARAFAGGDENAAKDMNQFIGITDMIRERTRATVMVIHHSGKDETKGLRGSTALLGAVDTLIKVTKRGLRGGVAEVKKMKDGEDGQRHRFRMVEAATERVGKTTLVMEPEGMDPADGEGGADEAPPEAAGSPQEGKGGPSGTYQRLALMALRKAVENGAAQVVHLNEYGNVKAMSMETWKRYCEAEPFSGSPLWRKRQRIDNICANLVANNHVLHAQGYVWERKA